ncbi:NUDIX domain-containing protein [Nocardioides sp. W3-2-3]|uniref:NUDIX domain-containing protein n=1 Tax=Nocardioides convexus TaxID=2712224 RepID=UPI0024188867|nr:NUDIX domain-containing protein [Nocardioides convexus]NHA00510.1 NUDIX domain-containing protein [Nocardioides convexus]
MEIEVVGAVVLREGLVLCAQRGPGGSLAGRWEFPGGKVEPGEAPVAALEREIAEEPALRRRGRRARRHHPVRRRPGRRRAHDLLVHPRLRHPSGSPSTPSLRWVAPGEPG